MVAPLPILLERDHHVCGRKLRRVHQAVLGVKVGPGNGELGQHVCHAATKVAHLTIALCLGVQPTSAVAIARGNEGKKKS